MRTFADLQENIKIFWSEIKTGKEYNFIIINPAKAQIQEDKSNRMERVIFQARSYDDKDDEFPTNINYELYIPVESAAKHIYKKLIQKKLIKEKQILLSFKRTGETKGFEFDISKLN